MLCSRFLRVVHSKKGFAGLMDRGVRRAAARATSGASATCCATGWRCCVVFVARARRHRADVGIVPNGFIPDQDNDSLFVNLQAAQGTSYYDMAKWTQQVADIVIKNPYVDSFMASVGGGTGGGGRRRREQRPPHCAADAARDTRPVSAQQIAQQIRPQLLRFPGFRGFVACRRRCRSAAGWATRTSAS